MPPNVDAVAGVVADVRSLADGSSPMACIEAMMPKKVARIEIGARIIRTILCASLHSLVMISRSAQPNQVLLPAHPAIADDRHAEMLFSIIFEPERWPWTQAIESPNARLQMIGGRGCVQVEPEQGFPSGPTRLIPTWAAENFGKPG